MPQFGGAFNPGNRPLLMLHADGSLATGVVSSIVNTWLGNLIAPLTRAGQYNAEQARPNLLPAPEALFNAWRRGFIGDKVAADALSSQGILPLNPTQIPDLPGLPEGEQARNVIASGLNVPTKNWYAQLWDRMSMLSLSIPDISSVSQLAVQGRINAEQYGRLTRNTFVDHERWRILAQAQHVTMNWADAWVLRNIGPQYGGISDAVYNELAVTAGWTDPQARFWQEMSTQVPTLPELMLWYYRSSDNPNRDDQFLHFRRALGLWNNTATEMSLLANKPMPGPSDLVRMAVREAWDEPTARAWGYDDEFPAPFAAWMQWHGLNWGEQLTGANGQQIPLVTWPQAYWRAHWQIISPQQAYRAVHLLRPDRLARYQSIAPGVTAFTPADLQRVLKVSDYPPKMRAWLAAIAFVPLRLIEIRQAYIAKLRSRQWAVDQMLDRGYVLDDANTAVDLWDARDQLALQRSYESIQRGVLRETVAELRTAYRMGGIDSATLHSRLTGLGFPQGFQDRVAALEDAKAARENLAVFIRQLRRSYLTGALTDVEVQASLTAARLAPQAIARYLRLWSAELTVERRSLSTAQLIRAVSAGQLAPAIAAVRLGRLGWTAPDAALLLQQAADKLTQAQAKAAQAQVHQAQQQAKALLQARKAAAQAQQSAQSRLRRIYPLAALKRQFCLGIRKEATIRVLLSSQGYDRDAIDGLLKQWVLECEKMPPAEPTAVKSVEAYTRRQTPLGTVKRWYQNGIVTRSWTQRRLATAGFAPESISGYLREWDATLGKKPGPAPEGAQAALP